MIATCVSLSSGETFYVDARIDDVVGALSAGGLVAIGGRYVNVSQVAQITTQAVPSMLGVTPERLEDQDGTISE